MSKGVLMKKLMFILIMAVLILPVAHAEYLNVIANSVQPQPAQPGNDLTVQVTYSNTQASNSHVYANLDLSYPFSLKSSTEPLENGFDLCSLCSRTNSYYIHTDSSAKSGIYHILIRSGKNSEFLRTINVTVIGKPNLILSSDAITNATPSKAFDMNVRVINIGTGIAKQVSVSSPSNNFVTLGGSISTTETIGPNTSSIINFQMSPGVDLNAGSYNVPFNMQYTDELGSSYNVTQNIGVQIVNEGQLNIESTKVSSSTGAQPTAGQPVSVIVRLENIGHGNADSIEAGLTCDGQKSNAFLGQLKKNEDAPAVFEMTIPSGGKQTCMMITSYTDDLGAHTITSTFDITLKSPEFPVGIVVIIIIIAGAAYYMKRRKKGR